MPAQREGGVTLSIASCGGEMAWIANTLLQVSPSDTLKFVNDEYQEIRDGYPGEFAMMANAYALDESCRPIVEDMIAQGGAKAIAIASSYANGANREYLDSPKAEWLWEFAEANDLVVHVHPPMLSVGNEVLTQYRLNEAVGRPFDSTLTVSRMIGAGVFDRDPNLQVMIVHMGGELPSILGRLDFTWHLNYEGVANPPAGAPYTNKRPPSSYFKTNILVDSMGSARSRCVPRLRSAAWTGWCSAPTSVRCPTGSRNTSRSSKTWWRARPSATWCSGRPATRYSAWAWRSESNPLAVQGHPGSQI